MALTDTGGYAFHPDYQSEPKDDYYINWGRYILYRAQTSELNYFRQKSFLNRYFSNGDNNNNYQWIFTDDIDFFLNDESGFPRMRRMLSENIIFPIMRVIKNMAIVNDFEFTLKPMSEYSKRKFDRELRRIQGIGDISKLVGGQVGKHIQDNYPIGDSDFETEKAFKSYYSDDFINGTNCLIRAVSEMNDLDGSTKEWLIEQLFVYGLGVVHDSEHNGYQTFEQLDAPRFIYDPSALRYDLQDGSYMGDYWMENPPNLFAQYPDLDDDQRKAINEASKVVTNGRQWYNNAWMGNVTGRVRVMRAYWRDNKYRLEGVVRTEYGDELFTAVDSENSLYTSDDLLEFSEIQTKTFRDVLKGKKSRKVLREVIRFVKFVDTVNDPGNTQSNLPLILEKGELSNSETNPFAFGRTQFPYKARCFAYLWGVPQGIVDFIIDSQRLINEILSVREQQINSYQPPVTLYDKRIIDPQSGGEVQFRQNIQNGVPTPVLSGVTGGVPNAVFSKPGTDLRSLQELDAVKNSIQTAAINTTGANQAMLGSAMNELARTNAMQLQQGNLMQEDIFSALSDIIRQCYQSVATRGRKIYYDNPANLSYSLANDGQREILADMDSLGEQVLVKVSKALPHEKDVEIANQIATEFMMSGVIDKETYGKVINRCTRQELYAEVSRYVIRKGMAEAEEANRAIAQEQQMMGIEMEQRQQGVDMQRETTRSAQETAKYKADNELMGTMVKSAAQVKSKETPEVNENMVAV